MLLRSINFLYQKQHTSLDVDRLNFLFQYILSSARPRKTVKIVLSINNKKQLRKNYCKMVVLSLQSNILLFIFSTSVHCLFMDMRKWSCIGI